MLQDFLNAITRLARATSEVLHPGPVLAAIWPSHIPNHNDAMPARKFFKRPITGSPEGVDVASPSYT